MLGFSTVGGAPVGDDGVGSAPPTPGVYTLAASTGAFHLTGATAGVRYGLTMTAATGAFVLSGMPILFNRLNLTPGVFTLTIAANVARSRRLSAGAGSYTLNGVANQMNPAYLLAAGAGGFNLSGSSLGIKLNRGFVPAPGAFHLTLAASPTVVRRLPITGATFALTGAASTFFLGYTLNTTAGSFMLSGSAANLAAMRRMSAGSTSFALTGFAVVFHAVHTLAQVAGGFLLSAPVGFKMARDRKIAAAVGTYVLTGGTITTPKVSRTLTLAPGAFHLAGLAITEKHVRNLTAGAGAFHVLGQPTTLKTGYTPLSVNPGAFHLTGATVSMSRVHKLVLSPGVFNVFTYDGQMVYSGAANLTNGTRWIVQDFMTNDGAYRNLPAPETIVSPANGINCETGSFDVTTYGSTQLGRLMHLATGTFSLTGHS